jgi:hypothetical protein
MLPAATASTKVCVRVCTLLSSCCWLGSQTLSLSLSLSFSLTVSLYRSLSERGRLSRSRARSLSRSLALALALARALSSLSYEGPEIVDALLSIDPLAAKHVDNLGQVYEILNIHCIFDVQYEFLFYSQAVVN